jgi:type I restriction enzyme M protein
MALVLDPKSNRSALFRAHSALRSADNLRPDEAFDELVKLYSIWAELGPVEIDGALARRFELRLSPVARRVASDALWPLLDGATHGLGADLFQELADVAVRSGLGQYFTPGPVASAMADFLAPAPGEHWMDPFVGSGLLLGAVALAAPAPVHLYGTDLDPRVLRVAALEAGLRHPDSPLGAVKANALDPPRQLLAAVGAPARGVDGIVTNPPFGAVDLNGAGARTFELVQETNTPIEVLAIEQCLQLLAPGGRLGIVLPQGVLSNKRLRYVREFVRTSSRIDGVLSLPAEAFSMFEGVGKASVLFLSKAEPNGHSVWFGRSLSVGWDTTGRRGADEDVRKIASAMGAGAAIQGRAECRPLAVDMDRNLTAEWQIRDVTDGVPLGELAERIFTGKTPSRAQYGDKQPSALRIVKVGNLTGRGMDWTEGDRSFASLARIPSDRLLQLGDIVLTAAAHHPRYIGAKVDTIDALPSDWEGRCLPSGELLVIRMPNSSDARLPLLLWLRSAPGRAAIQACITGQTAHLHPEYVAEVRVPRPVLEADTTAAARLVADGLEHRRMSEVLQIRARELFALALGA